MARRPRCPRQGPSALDPSPQRRGSQLPLLPHWHRRPARNDRRGQLLRIQPVVDLRSITMGSRFRPTETSRSTLRWMCFGRRLHIGQFDSSMSHSADGIINGLDLPMMSDQEKTQEIHSMYSWNRTMVLLGSLIEPPRFLSFTTLPFLTKSFTEMIGT